MPNKIFTIDEIITDYYNFIKKNNFSNNFKIIEKALKFAQKAHKGQRRISGQHYIYHPVEVSKALIIKFGDINMAQAALLHDTVEDGPNTNISEIYEQFGDEIGFMIDAVTKTIPTFYKEEKFHGKGVDKVLYGGMKDVKILILKIADRQHNLITLRNLPKHKQIRLAFETQAIYEPLKSILVCTKNNITIEQKQKTLDKFLTKNSISNYLELKDLLYNYTFEDFDNETFNLVYKNSQNITWRINEKIMYEKLINMSYFDENFEVLKLEMSENGKFSCIFRFKKGEILTKFGSKLEIENSEFINITN